MSVFDPGSGEKLHGWPAEDADFAGMGDDFGVLGIDAFAPSDCGCIVGDGIALPRASYHVSSGGLDSVPSAATVFDIGLIEGE